jgi:hypothetical protein
MALPAEAGKLFWLDPVNLADPNSRIFRADLDGSNGVLGGIGQDRSRKSRWFECRDGR